MLRICCHCCDSGCFLKSGMIFLIHNLLQNAPPASLCPSEPPRFGSEALSGCPPSHQPKSSQPFPCQLSHTLSWLPSCYRSWKRGQWADWALLWLSGGTGQESSEQLTLALHVSVPGTWFPARLTRFYPISWFGVPLRMAGSNHICLEVFQQKHFP